MGRRALQFIIALILFAPLRGEIVTQSLQLVHGLQRQRNLRAGVGISKPCTV